MPQQTEPDQVEPEQWGRTEPDQVEPEQSEPDQAEPDQVEPDQVEPGSQQGSEPDSQPQPEPGSQPEPDSQPQPEPGSQPEPDSQPQPQPGSQQLTAGFEDVPASHTGSGRVTVRVAFSEPVSTSYVVMRDDSFEVTGATVTGARRVDGRSDLWELTLRVDGTDDIAIALPADRACDATGGVCTADGHRLANRAETTIPIAPLTAEFEDVPASHTGSGSITVRVAFSEPVSTSYVVMRDDSFDVTGATVTGARRVDRRSDLWELTLRVDGTDDITIALPADRACDTTGAVCTSGGNRLANRPEATIAGPS